MPASRPNPPQIDLAKDWLEYAAQNHGQLLEMLRFWLAALVTMLVLIDGFRILTDPRQQPDLQKLSIGLMGTALGASLSPLRRD
jgi:hypothetical protein